jgi:dTDP-4-amino-4,6-dideoxygalactose transaminase
MIDKLEKPVFVTQPKMPPLNEFIPYLENIWDSKWLTNNGSFHQQLEKSLCEYLGVKYISLFSNGTLALITALQALRMTGEVITTPFSFVATTHALWWNGIKPVFVDIEPDFFNIDAEKIESAITPKTTAILPVHVYGTPCNVEKIQTIADTYGIKVIYDACHAFGVTINGQSVLSFGDLSILSFHATKVYNTFEGGAIVCHDEKTKKRIDYLKNFGFADEVTVVAPGINAKMNEFQSAFGLLQLKYVADAIKRRKEITDVYREKLGNLKGITLLKEKPGVQQCYPYFPILVHTATYGMTRDDLYYKLREKNIYARRYFYPLISNFSMYKGLPSSSAENLPVAERVAKEVLCLPIFPDMEQKVQNAIIEIVVNKAWSP